MGDNTVPPPTPTSAKVVFVTGFGPFGNHPINASWEAVKLLKDKSPAPDVQLITREIVVKYDTIKEVVPQIWNEYKPLLLVHVGVSGIAQKLTLEKLAHNDGYNKLDVGEQQPRDECCVAGGHRELWSCIDMDTVCAEVNEEMAEQQVEADVSEDPGRYLCDFIYYTSLHHLHVKEHMGCCIAKGDEEGCVAKGDEKGRVAKGDEGICVAKGEEGGCIVSSNEGDCSDADHQAIRCGSLHHGSTVFIHVPPLEKPYSAQQLADGILATIRSILKQLGE